MKFDTTCRVAGLVASLTVIQCVASVIFDVHSYRAKDDGTTKDTVSIHAALDEVDDLYHAEGIKGRTAFNFVAVYTPASRGLIGDCSRKIRRRVHCLHSCSYPLVA